jgi:hypothetical protein
LLGALAIWAVLMSGHGIDSFAQESDGPDFTGLDEAVNETLAEQAGRPARDPLIDTEAWGELWNLLLLGAGAICGFIVGRYWNQIWGRDRRTDSDESP